MMVPNERSCPARTVTCNSTLLGNDQHYFRSWGARGAWEASDRRDGLVSDRSCVRGVQVLCDLSPKSQASGRWCVNLPRILTFWESY